MRHNTRSLWNELQTIERKAGVSQITRSRMCLRISFRDARAIKNYVAFFWLR
jgi:hypothetical protein